MDISSAQLPLDTDERSQLPPSVTDAAREERLRRRRERERARRASERPEEKEARYVKKQIAPFWGFNGHLLNVGCVYL